MQLCFHSLSQLTQNICTTFVQCRLGRWDDIVQMLYKRIVFSGMSDLWFQSVKTNLTGMQR